MYYNSGITRNNPTCFLFVIDQSSSMAQPFGDRSAGAITKAEGVATAINNLLRNLIITCSKADGVRNYFDVGIIGYGATVGPAWGGALAGRELVPIAEVASSYLRLNEKVEIVDDGTGNRIEQKTRTPVWIAPAAKGSTLMCEALTYAGRVLNHWLGNNPSSFPPVVVHITDGEATDGDPAPRMKEITSLSSVNGPVLLVNVHLSSKWGAEPVSFPDSAADLPDSFSRMLFSHASVLTPTMRQVAWDHGLMLTENARAFVMNADPTLVVLALEIGTRPGNVW